MEWALLLVALTLLAGLGALRAARARHSPDPPATSAPAPRSGGKVEPMPMHSDDQAELEAMFAAVDEEILDDLQRLLAARMKGVMLRQVPVRVIRASPAPSVARICFSDGTIVLATTHRPGDMVQMAFAMLRTSVTLNAFELTEEGPSLRFGWRPDGELEVIAVGLDQSD